MTRAGSHKRTHGSDNRQESLIIHGIDDHDKWMETLTTDEHIAVKLLCDEGLATKCEHLTGKYSRQWAIKTVDKLLHGRLVSMALRFAFREKNLARVMPLFEYFVPKPKQVIEASGPDGGPIEISAREPTYEELLTAATMVNARKLLMATTEQDNDNNGCE